MHIAEDGRMSETGTKYKKTSRGTTESLASKYDPRRTSNEDPSKSSYLSSLKPEDLLPESPEIKRNLQHQSVR
ncbi:hypothetical protein O3M35_006035 [Rhynocoris fuscipes]|uniref:Uncharacterized protein n=1 Tax=Rhynocoris fuscipes TaxID=488301 RepID=A0AAW1DEG7_9HEMI